jgi:hypothetical protein
MTTANNSAADAGLSRSFWAVGVFGVVLSLGSLAVVDQWQGTLSVAAGACIALLNFWMTAYLVRGFVAPDGVRLPWALIASVKLLFVLGGVYVLLQRGVLELLPMAVGFGALPLGIVFGQTRPRPVKGELSDA